MKLLINGVLLAPGGGMTGLIGYINAWKSIAPDMEIVVLVSNPAVGKSVRSIRPDIDTRLVFEGQPRWRRFLSHQFQLLALPIVECLSGGLPHTIPQDASRSLRRVCERQYPAFARKSAGH